MAAVIAGELFCPSTGRFHNISVQILPKAAMPVVQKQRLLTPEAKRLREQLYGDTMTCATTASNAYSSSSVWPGGGARGWGRGSSSWLSPLMPRRPNGERGAGGGAATGAGSTNNAHHHARHTTNEKLKPAAYSGEVRLLRSAAPWIIGLAVIACEHESRCLTSW